MSVKLYECRACGEWFDVEEAAPIEACPYCGGHFFNSSTVSVSNDPGASPAFSFLEGCEDLTDNPFT
jgi:DNA-directed RNA polymerase subunit RPC12/RpoP